MTFFCFFFFLAPRNVNVSTPFCGVVLLVQKTGSSGRCKRTKVKHFQNKYFYYKPIKNGIVRYKNNENFNLLLFFTMSTIR